MASSIPYRRPSSITNQTNNHQDNGVIPGSIQKVNQLGNDFNRVNENHDDDKSQQQQFRRQQRINRSINRQKQQNCNNLVENSNFRTGNSQINGFDNAMDHSSFHNENTAASSAPNDVICSQNESKQIHRQRQSSNESFDSSRVEYAEEGRNSKMRSEALMNVRSSDSLANSTITLVESSPSLPQISYQHYDVMAISKNHIGKRPQSNGSFKNTNLERSRTISTTSTIASELQQIPPFIKLSLRQALPITPILMLCSFLVAFDSTLVSVLLSDISSSFNSSQHASWIGTSYLLTICIFTPLYPRLSDIFGRKQMLLAALLIFTIGTAACGSFLSSTITSLAIFRAIAGMGGGGMQTLGNIILTDLVSTRDRGVLVGVSNIIFCSGLALGGPVGGYLGDTVGWRMAFGIQIPVLCTAYFIIWKLLPETLATKKVLADLKTNKTQTTKFQINDGTTRAESPIKSCNYFFDSLHDRESYFPENQRGAVGSHPTSPVSCDGRMLLRTNHKHKSSDHTDTASNACQQFIQSSSPQNEARFPNRVCSGSSNSTKCNSRSIESKSASSENHSILSTLDILGALYLSIWVSALITGISFKGPQELPWSSPYVYFSFGTSVTAFFAFVYAEYKAKLPVMPLRLFSQRNPLLVFIISFLLSFMIFVCSFSMPILLRTVQLRPSHEVGLVMFPSALWSALASLLTGIYIRWSGKYYGINVVMSIITLFTFSCLAFVDRQSSAKLIIACLIGFGISSTGSFTANFVGIIASVPVEDNAVTIGVIYLFRMLGQVLGVALSSALLQSKLVDNLNVVIQGPGSKELIESIRHRSDVVSELEPLLRSKVVTAYEASFHMVFKTTAIAAVIALILCIPIKVFKLTTVDSHIKLPDEEEDISSSNDVAILDSDTDTEL